MKKVIHWLFFGVESAWIPCGEKVLTHVPISPDDIPEPLGVVSKNPNEITCKACIKEVTRYSRPR
jgi:hypothetical protein